jgi:hypothetical protein
MSVTNQLTNCLEQRRSVPSRTTSYFVQSGCSLLQAQQHVPCHIRCQMKSVYLPQPCLFDHSNITLQLYLPRGIYHLVSPLNPSAGRPKVQFWQGQQIFLFSRPPIPVLGPTHPHIQWVPEVVSRGKMRAGCEADELLPKLRNSGDVLLFPHTSSLRAQRRYLSASTEYLAQHDLLR